MLVFWLGIGTYLSVNPIDMHENRILLSTSISSKQKLIAINVRWLFCGKTAGTSTMSFVMQDIWYVVGIQDEICLVSLQANVRSDQFRWWRYQNCGTDEAFVSIQAISLARGTPLISIMIQYSLGTSVINLSFGSSGNLLNVSTFLNLMVFRRNSCAFDLMMESLANL